MEARATARYLRTAPRKLRVVADQVRGKPLEEAFELLALSPKASAEPLRKLLESAAANAEDQHGLEPDELVVTSLAVDEGPTLRRYRPRAMGRATPVRRRTSHVHVTVGVPETSGTDRPRR